MMPCQYLKYLKIILNSGKTACLWADEQPKSHRIASNRTMDEDQWLGAF